MNFKKIIKIKQELNNNKIMTTEQVIHNKNEIPNGRSKARNSFYSRPFLFGVYLLYLKIPLRKLIKRLMV